MESSQVIQSLTSQRLNSSCGWNDEEVQLALCLQIFALPSCPDC